jgi:PAS domain S-box-containing protein
MFICRVTVSLHMRTESLSRWVAYNLLAWMASVAIVGLSAFAIWNEYNVGYKRAEAAVLNTASILANQVESTFDHADTLLTTVGKRYVSALARGKPEVERLIEEVRQELPSFSLVTRLGISDRNGRVILNTGFEKNSSYSIDITDRENFARAKAGERNLIHVGPVKAKLTDEWSLTLSRRLEDAKGDFIGIIFAILPVDAFGKDFFGLDLGATGSINIRTLDLAQVARYPQLQGAEQLTGNRNVSRTITALMRANPGQAQYTYTTVAPIDGIERFYAYKKFDHSPYWMTIGFSTRDFQLHWRQTTGVLLLLVMAIVGLLFWGGRKLGQQHQSLRQQIVANERVERELRDSEGRVKSMLNAIPDLLFRMDRGGRVLEHKLTTDVSGLPSAVPAFLSTLQEQIRTTLESNQLQTIEYEMPVSGEATRVYEMRMVPSSRDEVTAVARDITARKQMERELEQYRLQLESLVRQRTAALHEAEVKYRTVADFTYDWETWTDASGHWLYCSPACERVTGYRAEEFMARSALYLDITHPDDRAKLSAHLHEGEREGIGDLEYRIQHRNGDVRWINHLCQPVRNEAGKSLGRRVSNRDITDRKRAEDQLRQARDQAEAANLAKSTFLANMSHEIRTPLNGIVGMTHLLRRGTATPLQLDRLEKIDAAAAHLLSIINNILDLSKIEAGKILLEETPVSINSLLINVKSILGARAQAKGLLLRVEMDAGLPDVQGDATRLQQALLNYVSNAIKFTDSGSITLRTTMLDVDDDSVRIRFEVQDSGIGISAPVLSRLFTPFEQADNSTSRKYGGTGLGLAITRRLAELMGGEAGAESSPGVGSTFWFTARLARSTLRALPVRTEISESEKRLRQQHRGRHILIVDDEPLNLEVAQYMLEEIGLRVDTAVDGASALSLARENAYAAILMDMQMPTLDGLEATKQLRTLPGYQDTPILAMTANAFAEDKARCLAAGMNDFIAKPVNSEQLYSLLLSWLESTLESPSAPGPVSVPGGAPAS